MIIAVSMNPAVDKTLILEHFSVDNVNRVVSSRLDPGGKGINVAKMVRRMEGETLAMGIVGGSNGAYIQRQLDKMGIAHDFVIGSGETRTNYKIIDSTQHTTTDLNEPGEPVTKELLDAVWCKLDKTARPGDAVVFAGANPPGMADTVLADWITRLRAKGVIIALDSTGESMRLGIAAKPTIIKPNQAELSEIVGEPLHYQRDMIAAARQINQQGVERVIVSMGAEGALFVTRECILRGYGVSVPVKSTVGAGDATLAAVIYCLQKGMDWEETARRSIAVGAANVMCEGTRTPTLEQVEALVDQVRIERLQ